MDVVEEVQEKLKRKNQILFSQKSEFLQDLSNLIDIQNHRTLALWAFELAEQAVQSIEEKYPNELRPRVALEDSKRWAFGEIKMPQAKKAILDCHAVAKEISSPEDIALCHAIGQACSVVHTVGHAMGFPIYELTAIVRKYSIDNCKDALEKRNNEYIDRLLYWQNHYEDYSGAWAKFMLK